MCGIAGIVQRFPTGVSVDTLGRMAAAIRHRGPDGYGFYVGQRVGFAHVRLNTVDIVGGAQPMTNEDGQIVVTHNGEIYNHPELRRELEEKGHIFRTRCDTEVLVHGYEEWGVDVLSRLNGHFAFAIYDRNADTVMLARDRFGVRPLFYAQRKGALYFGSEAKAILATGEVEAAPDCRGLDEVFTFFAARPPRTVFAGIASLEPGTYGILQDGALWLRRYYELDYPEAAAEADDVIEQLDEIMLRSVGMRLRADVAVGAYISGGLDSSITASLAARGSPQTLRTFSIAAGDPSLSERELQLAVAADIGSIHEIATVAKGSLEGSLPEVLWHTETPLLQTRAATMYHLAKLTRDCGIKVVLSGTGADELFLGSDLFKETSVRRFCLRQPSSLARQCLIDRLYPELIEREGSESWRSFLLHAGQPRDPIFSHLPRFLLSAATRELYSPEFKARLAGVDVLSELRGSLPVRYFGWSSLNQAAYLEMTTFLSPYVLASHGDRMAMAHGVEERTPFLDHRLFEFAAALPTGSRLRGLKDKEILRRWASRILPARTKERRKPAAHSRPETPNLLASGAPEWIKDHLSVDAIRRAGVFSMPAVDALIKRCQHGGTVGSADSHAITGLVSTQVWHDQFIEHLSLPAPLPASGASQMLTETTPAYTAPIR